MRPTTRASTIQVAGHVLVVALTIAFCTSTGAETLLTVAPEQVMTGNSSAFANGVWLRFTGQPGHINCFYAPSNASLFYTKPGGVLDPNKALAVLTMAKLAGRTVNFEYSPSGAFADFWGYGYSTCEIRQLILN